MTTATQLQITPDTRIGDIVAARPALARLFEGLRIDYCCAGKQTLAAASASRGLATGTVVAMLEAAMSVLEAGPAEVDAAAMSLTELADHIEHTHHAYLKEELPRLVEMADRVAYKHGERDTRLGEVAAIVRELAAEMLAHMEKEEGILFPLARRIDAGERVDLAGPIAQMEAEHESAGNLTERLRGLTDGFTPGPDACNTHRALLAGLADFESDLHRHVHKENNVLFPRALARGNAG
jgi:regulator of cell morphogenesis and NO signaling